MILLDAYALVAFHVGGPISRMDTVLLASTGVDDRLATADPDVLAVADAEKIATAALPGQA